MMAPWPLRVFVVVSGVVTTFIAIAMVATGSDPQFLIAAPLMLPYSAVAAYSLVRRQPMPAWVPLAIVVVPGIIGLAWIVLRGDLRPLSALLGTVSLVCVVLLFRMQKSA